MSGIASNWISREILECIFEYCSLTDIKNCARVDKTWKQHVWNFVKSIALTTFVKDATVEFIAENCNSLTSLDLTNCCNITDTALETLNQLSGLKELKLRGCSNVTCEGVQNLKNLTRYVKPERLAWSDFFFRL